MNKTFLLEIVTPEKLIFSQEIEELVVPAAKGEITLLRDHSPFISLLRAGRIKIKSAGENLEYVLYAGFVEFYENKARILTENIEKLEDICHKTLAQRIEDAKLDLENSECAISRNVSEDILNSLTSLHHSLQN